MSGETADIRHPTAPALHVLQKNFERLEIILYKSRVFTLSFNEVEHLGYIVFHPLSLTSVSLEFFVVWGCFLTLTAIIITPNLR